MATVTKKKKVQEMLNSPEVIDTSCDMNLPIQEQMVEKKYKCTCCGESWDKRTNHFAKTASPLFQSNGGYLPICNKCRDRYYNKLVKLYNGNEIHAIRHFCIQFDIIFELNALKNLVIGINKFLIPFITHIFASKIIYIAIFFNHS